MNRYVILKICHKQTNYAGLQERMFLHLISESSSLSNNCIQLYTTILYGSHLILILENLSIDLLSYLNQISYITDVSTLRHITLQLILILIKLEQSNIIHADLKPENLLLTTGFKTTTRRARRRRGSRDDVYK